MGTKGEMGCEINHAAITRDDDDDDGSSMVKLCVALSKRIWRLLGKSGNVLQMFMLHKCVYL